MKKIIVTGGHLTPALAVMEELKKHGWDIVYVGRIHAMENDSATSQEERIVREKGYTFTHINTGKLQRHLSLTAVKSILKIPIGCIQSYRLLQEYKPSVVLSFGGYLGFPVSLCARFLSIPVVLHEQTMQPGLTNRVLSKIAKQICISWPETEKYFKSDKVVLTGNPLRKEIYENSNSLKIVADKPILYVTGGNLGSHSINAVVGHAVTELTKHFTVIHQCGNASEFNDFKKLQEMREKLPASQKAGYYIFEYIDDDGLGWILSHAACLVSRAGANTISEIIALKKAAILIPLPWSGALEQVRSAEFLQTHGAALILPQEKLTARFLIEEIEALMSQKITIEKNLQKLQSYILPNAAEKITNVLESYA
jgi:UDP-N-acetylglucosamine--N-acetylmuramyl-(pentapeptide) pyrophosphoryl-undecaprenol N-acetylglucosamine transferase